MAESRTRTLLTTERLATVVLAAMLATLALMIAEDRLVRLDIGIVRDLRAPQRTFELVAWAVLARWLLRITPLERPFQQRSFVGVLLGATGGVLLLNVVIRTAAERSVLRPLGLIAVTAGLVLLSRLGRRRLEVVLLLALAALLVGSIALGAAGHGNVVGMGRLTGGLLGDFRLRGLFPGPIQLGAAAGVTFVVAAQATATGTLGRRTGFALVALSSLTIVLADALTAALGVVLALGARWVVHHLPSVAPRAAGRLTGRAAPLVAAGGGVAVLVLPFALARSGLPVGLTGRVNLWRRVLELVPPEELVRGLGYQPLAVERPLNPSLAIGWAPEHTHSVPFEMVLTAGVAGAVAFAVLAAALILAALRTADVSHGWSTALVVLVLASWSTEEYLMSLEPADQLLLAGLLAMLLGWLREPLRPTGTDLPRSRGALRSRVRGDARRAP